jgi:beta-N-acetylhexosaminidase
MIMVSTAYYSRLDAGNAATWSSTIIGGLLRRELGFGGVVITDDLTSQGVTERMSPAAAALASAEAGADILLLAASPETVHDVYAQLKVAARRGDLSSSELTASYKRILALKKRFAP